MVQIRAAKGFFQIIMDDDCILISQLNDFIFCPASIYFHLLYGGREKLTFQQAPQLNGFMEHSAVDTARYSSRKSILQGISVYSEKYNLTGKIDIYDSARHLLTERKKKIKFIYDGYIFQIYAQYFAMTEMGYIIDKLRLYSMDDNRSYDIPLPEQNPAMLRKFEQTVYELKNFELARFRQTNIEKCRNCIYEPACDRSLL